MSLVPIKDVDPQNPPKCKTCNDYGGLMDDELNDPAELGLPLTQVCPDCPNSQED